MPDETKTTTTTPPEEKTPAAPATDPKETSKTAVDNSEIVKMQKTIKSLQTQIASFEEKNASNESAMSELNKLMETLKAAPIEKKNDVSFLRSICDEAMAILYG